MAGSCPMVRAQANGDRSIHLTIESDCKAVCKLGDQLQDVDPYREFTWRRGGPQTLQMAPQCLSHPACPVPSGIIKAIEVASGLALPMDASITISR